MNIEDTLADRGKTHGNFCEQFALSQMLKHQMHTQDGWEKLTLSQQEAMEMIAMKMSRIVVGDSNHADNWHDIVGYASLIEGTLNES